MGMNILSCFDGMSCGQIALYNLGIYDYNYFASEIDKYAMSVTQHNFPDTIQMGDVTKVTSGQLPGIDLLIGGSPCQGFSFAGKQLNFDDPRSKLFFEFVRLKNELQPTYFLLENVVMKQEHQDVITEHLGVEPIFINSKTFSPQDRKRLYWTNIPIEPYPAINSMVLRDILEENVPEQYFISPEVQQRYFDKEYVKNTGKSCVMGALSKYQGDRVFDIDCKGSSLSAFGGNNGGGSCHLIFDHDRIRRLTPIECEKLQVVPLNYTKVDGISDGKRYTMLGNGWTVAVIEYIFSHIKNK